MPSKVDQELASAQNGCHDSDQEEELFFNAVIRNDTEPVASLLACAKFNVDAMNGTRKTALYLAIKNQNLAIIRSLCKAGADLNKRSFCNEHNAFELPIVTAAHVHNLELVQLLIDSGCGSEAEHLKDGKSALQWAAGYGDITMAKLLLEHGSDVNWIGPHFQTALHFAVIAEKREMAVWLLEHQAKIMINGDHRTALHIAAVKGNFPIVCSLLEHGARPDVLDAYGNTPFSLASLRGYTDIVKHFAKVCVREELSIGLALEKAAEFGHDEVVSFLLDDMGADVNARLPSGETPLMGAAKNHLSTTLLLLEHDACIEVADSRGLTPLTNAMMRDQMEIAAVLIRHGATLDHIHMCDTAPESPLRLAYNMSNASLLKYMIEAGVHMCREPWFSVKAAEQKIVELEFSIPRTPGYRENIDLQKLTWVWIESKICNPRSLLELSRRTIRQAIMQASGGRSVLNRLHLLPLPPGLLKYVRLDEVMLD